MVSSVLVHCLIITERIKCSARWNLEISLTIMFTVHFLSRIKARVWIRANKSEDYWSCNLIGGDRGEHSLER